MDELVVVISVISLCAAMYVITIITLVYAINVLSKGKNNNKEEDKNE